MEKRAKKFKIQKTLEFLKKPRKKLPFRRLFHHTKNKQKKTHSSLRART